MSVYKIDRREIERDGYTVELYTTPDDESNYDGPLEMGDCYTPRQVKAFYADDWSYVVIVATASRSGVELGSSALGGVEAGWFLLTDENDRGDERRDLDPLNDPEYVDDLVSEAIGEADKKLRELCAEMGSQS
jgi:hypothetical protein